MNKEICKILKDRIAADSSINFLDVIAGLAQLVRYGEAVEGGGTIYKSMPVAYDIATPDGCQVSPETAVIPNSMKKGILYFEEAGTNISQFKKHRGGKYTSTLNLVCWVNKANLGYSTTEELTAILITKILDAVITSGNRDNVGSFIGLHITPVRINPQDSSVFNKYTYDEEATQFLRPPFEFFSIMLNIEYGINPKCINDFDLKNKLCY